VKDHEEIVRRALGSVLEVSADSLVPTALFADYGVDSLIGLRFARRLEEELDAPVEIEWLFDHPTIRQLAVFLDRQFATVSSDQSDTAT
jgi:hypothetical protein